MFLSVAQAQPREQIKLLPDQDQEISVKPFKIHHLLLSKAALRPDTFYRLVVSFHGSVCLFSPPTSIFRVLKNTSMTEK